MNNQIVVPSFTLPKVPFEIKTPINNSLNISNSSNNEKSPQSEILGRLRLEKIESLENSLQSEISGRLCLEKKVEELEKLISEQQKVINYMKTQLKKIIK